MKPRKGLGDEILVQHNPLVIERTIHFFHANVGYQEDGLPLDFDPIPALRSIETLRRQRAQRWYEAEQQDVSALCLFPDMASYRYPVAQFGRVRWQALPQLERVGDITELELADRQGLLESIHVVFFPGNVVGAAYNHYGPRATRLGNHLHTVSEEPTPMVNINPVIREDPFDQLNDVDSVHVMDLEFLPPATAIIAARHSPAIGAALGSAAAVSNGARSLTLVIKPDQDDEQGFWNGIRGGIRELFGDEELRPHIKRGKLQGRRGLHTPLETFDLLRDEITSTQQMMRLTARGRALDPHSAFGAVINAYEGLREEIRQSPTVAARLQDDLV